MREHKQVEKKSYRFELMAMVLSFMVVMIHSSYAKFYTISEGVEIFLSEYYTDYISGFAVPCFFLLSAMKFYRNYDYSKTAEKLKKRIHSLFIPYLAWNVISVLWAILLNTIPFLSKMISVRDRFTFTVENFIGGIFWYKYIHAFWYMALLIVFTLLCPLIYTIIKNKQVGLLVVAALYLTDAVVEKFPATAWPMFQIRTLVYCSAFYILGAWIGKYAFEKVCQEPEKKVRIPAILMFIVAVSVRAVTGNSRIVFIPAILLGGYALWLLVGTIKCSKSDILYTSFFIYPAHTFVLPCVNKLLYLVFPDTNLMCILNTVLGTILTYIICIILACIVKKYFPKCFWSILNGSRS